MCDNTAYQSQSGRGATTTGQGAVERAEVEQPRGRREQHTSRRRGGHMLLIIPLLLVAVFFRGVFGSRYVSKRGSWHGEPARGVLRALLALSLKYSLIASSG